MTPARISHIIEIIAALFILVFVYTAMSKLFTLHTFTITLKNSPLIAFAGGALSWFVPAVELAISALLFFPATRKTGLMATLSLMTTFTLYIAYMLFTSAQLPCSCGGIISTLSWEQHLWINVFLTTLAAAAVFLNKRLNFLLQ